VEKKLHYGLGQKIVLTHGTSSKSGAGILDHSEKPFTVVGILNQTATPVDRLLYITLEGAEAMHIDWTDGAPPMAGDEVPASAIRKGT
jgi:putative ABC transport system permease protein